MKFAPAKPPIYGQTLSALQHWLQNAGEPAFRAEQIMQWLYKKRANHWEEMTNLPQKLRATLDASFDIAPSKHLLDKQSADSTEKLLLQMGDASLDETVVIRAPQIGVGLTKSRKTICISTQVGCAYGCKFCASGLSG